MYQKPVLRRFGTLREITRLPVASGELPDGLEPLPGMPYPPLAGAGGGRIS